MNTGMKNTVVAIIAALSLASAAVSAEEKSAPPAGPGTQDSEQQMGMMQDHMMKMHEQMHKIMAAKSPQERQALTQEHRDMMKKQMTMMRGGMMAHDKKPGMGSDGKGGAATQKGGTKPGEHQH